MKAAKVLTRLVLAHTCLGLHCFIIRKVQTSNVMAYFLYLKWTLLSKDGNLNLLQAEVCWRDRRYLDVINNRIMCDLYHKHAIAAGVDFDAHGVGDADLSAGSTDMGNVSYVVPSIHPEFYIGTDAVNHTREFTEAAGKISIFEQPVIA